MIHSSYINALGWTLIHSIWQLTLLALVFYILLRLWKDCQPGHRYRVSLLFMLISLSITSITFIVMYDKFATIPGSGADLTEAYWPYILSIETPGNAGMWDSVVHFLQTNVTSLTYLYMTGVALLMLRMGINFWSLHRLKSQSHPIDPNHLDFLTGLMEKMNIRNPVAIRSSVRIQMPMVIGAFQPVVLIPLSLLSNTPPHILKAMMAHELAHVERHDFAINLIQSVVETLFFYHPAVWYFSYIARREREYCCDQRAVEVGCQREDLVRALTEVGELQHSQALSMSLGGQPNELLNRVKYLLGLQPSYRYAPDHSIWYYGSLLGVFLLFSIGKHQFFPTPDQTNSPPLAIFHADTIPQTEDREEEVIIIRQRHKKDGRVKKRTMVRVDTVKLDSVPRSGQVTTVISGPKRKIIVDGKEVKIYDRYPMQILQDSLFRKSRRMALSVLDQQHIDSVMQRLAETMADGASSISTYQFNLDSLQQKWLFFKPGLYSILPDSLPFPPFYADSLWSSRIVEKWQNGDFWVDSTFLKRWQDPEMMVYFKRPFIHPEQMEKFRERARETQEHRKEQLRRYMDQRERAREHQEKMRELGEKYREQYERSGEHREYLKKQEEMYQKLQEMERKIEQMEKKYKEELR